MRREARIENFLEKVNIKDLLLNIWKIYPNDIDAESYEKIIINNIDTIREFWHENYDLRFSQVLINLGLIENFPGFWYNYEEEYILKEQGYKPRDYIFWGNVYDKNGKKLDEVNYILIKNMNTDHIQNLINGGWLRSGSEMHKLMSDELKMRLRKDKLKKIKNI